MKVILISGSLVLHIMFQYPGNFKNNTGNNSTIVVPAGVTCDIDGTPMQTLDAIGLFFRRNGSLICAGYGTYIIAITVWADDYMTTFKAGFVLDEKYYFKIWDAQNGEEYLAQVEFNSRDLPSGVYYYKFSVGNVSITKKKILVR